MKTGLIVTCLMLVGCGGKSGNTPLRIANPGTGLQTQYLPISLADTLGFYKDERLAVSVENLPTAGKTMEALLAGSVDVAGISYLQAIQMAAEGRRVRAIFIGVRRISTILAVAPTAGNRIQRVEDLKGAVIGVPSFGSPNHLWMNYVLAEHGLRPSELKTVGIGSGASAIAAMESGRIDAASLSGGDHIRLLRRNAAARILFDGTTQEGMQETFGGDLFGSGALAARQEWLDRNSDTARRLARALQRSLRWIATHSPEEIRERLPVPFRSQDAAVDLEIIRWSLPMFTFDGRMPRGAPEAVKHFLDATIDKVRDTKIDLAATWTNQFLPEPK